MRRLLLVGARTAFGNVVPVSKSGPAKIAFSKFLEKTPVFATKSGCDLAGPVLKPELPIRAPSSCVVVGQGLGHIKKKCTTAQLVSNLSLESACLLCKIAMQIALLTDTTHTSSVHRSVTYFHGYYLFFFFYFMS